MTKEITELERRSYPEPEPLSEIDRQMFGPVDPIAKTNKRLTTALITMTALVCVSVLGIVGLVAYFQTRPVRVMSINAAGEVESFLLNLSGFTLHKSETQAALRNSITNWGEGFYSRLRTPINGDVATLAYPRSFLFLSNELAQVYSQREQREHEIAGFMSNGDSEFKVFVTNVVFRNLDRKPYEADIYFDRVYYSQPLIVSAKKSYFVPIRFSANPSDEEIERLRKRANLDIDSVMRINPLVIAITQIGEVRDFSTSPSSQQH